MLTVISKDGTTIAYDKIGNGPALILVDGALCYRASGPNGPLAQQLSQNFTVFIYDRRGRGDSNEKLPYSVEREVEDIEALINEAGESVFLYGISSGAALALEAASRISKIKKLALYEAPFIVDNSRPPVPDNYLEKLNELLRENRRGAMVKHFMRKGVGVPAFFVMMMQFMPVWSKLKSVAHTLPYDTILTVDYQKGKPLPDEAWNSITIPTLVISGSKSHTWMRNAMHSLANILPNAKYQTLEGQSHIVKPEVLAPMLVDFFGD